MPRYHISEKTDRPNICRAKPGNCPLKSGDSEPPHFDNKEDARAYIEEKNSQQYSEVASTKNKEEKIRYSFMKNFQEKENTFKKDFDGFPTRFFSTDLGKGQYCDMDEVLKAKGGSFETYEENLFVSVVTAEVLAREVDSDEFSDYLRRDEYLKNFGYIDNHKLSGRLAQSASSPSDGDVSDKKFEELAKECGAKSVKKVPAKYYPGASERAFVLTFDGREGSEQYVIATDKKQSAPSHRFFKGRSMIANEMGVEGSMHFISTDIRSVVGFYRIKRKTGVNLLKSSAHSTKKEDLSGETDIDRAISLNKNLKRLKRNNHTANTVIAYKKLKEAQEEGNSFIAQRKYIREASGKIATVWTDKKDQKDTHVDAAKDSKLRKTFSKIEIDNDVDLKEYKSFEKDFEEVKDKLPKIPNGLNPELRIRKLGKHNTKDFSVIGLYNPARNSLAIDVRNSSATIHEYGHFVDIALKDNVSLNAEFRELNKEYTKKLPERVRESKGFSEYLSTPTEVYARAFELYAHEKLGINNRLLNPEKYKKGDDFAPFREDKSLKEKYFTLLDKVFEK